MGRGVTHQFIEIERTSYATRLRNAVFGVLVGVIMIVSAFVLLLWNEERGLQAEQALSDALGEARSVSAYSIDPANEGRLIHVSGVAQTAGPAWDPAFRLAVPEALRLRRRVEMVQWHETAAEVVENGSDGDESKRLTYDYRLAWSEEPVGSANFRYFEGHQNPRMPVVTRIFNGEDAKIGAYRLSPPVLDRIDRFEPLAVSAARLGRPDGFVDHDGALYRGSDPDQLALGDLRIRYELVSPGPYTVMGRQSGDELTPWRSDDGFRMLLVEPGELSAAELVDGARYQEEWVTWLMRGIGFMMMTAGILFLLAPWSAFATTVPVATELVDAGIFRVALLASLPLTVLTIGGVWLVLAPFWSLALITLGFGAAVGLFVLLGR